jgi:hypothetical protein
MFNPKNEQIKLIAKSNPNVIQQLENFFDRNTNVYIDFANVLGWQKKLNWRVDIVRLKEFLDSFSSIKIIMKILFCGVETVTLPILLLTFLLQIKD